MAVYEYLTARDFDHAWLNFELDLPLPPGKNGQPNPFYVNRPGNPARILLDAVLAPFYRPPKLYFSGHRGCGKTTEMLHLLSHREVYRKYWPIHFSIREETDIVDLDFRDVLLAIGSRMYRAYTEMGGEIPSHLQQELSKWKGKVEQEIRTVLNGASSYELGSSIDAFFINAGLKMKLEPRMRVELRQVFEKDLSGLIDVINAISRAIQKREKRMPLLLIDDMDKPSFEQALSIFHDRREIMAQPECAIIYTVSTALFYSKEFNAIRDHAFFLPNVTLHPFKEPERHLTEGYETMRRFTYLRMDASLIDAQALEDAITYSGGVFREMARLIRSALGYARRRKGSQIEPQDVESAANEIRNEYRRILDNNDIAYLRKVSEHNRLEYHDRLRPLLQLLAILEYHDKENWCDIHPVLRKLVHEQS
ncbi:MAG: hypothetical protein N2049_11070 [Anaerolineales bacterium]|nr:hypothetical protein [Anaerolineales bacterium]MCX7609738.1 hypothetical protein [Anaerolineales bacterium]